MSPPEQPRRFFVDRSLGRVAVPKLLRRGDLTSAAYAERFVTNQQAVFAASNSPGPFIYAVHTDRLERLYPSHH
ncbi:hypothetical protein ACGF0J_30230 [Nonomuraea sp. NPDC047897]|uniref:hypothetical protein n=1 Tax=Nonomuraea sp. NPDC047897 TaxID=3364346 RepID=UPI0037127956